MALKMRKGLGAEERDRLLEAENGPQLTASKETGTPRDPHHKTLDSAIHLNEITSRFIPRAPRKECSPVTP